MSISARKVRVPPPEPRAVQPNLSSDFELDAATGVWIRPGFGGISYSDGADVEARIAAAIAAARDLSSHSPELAAQCLDWPLTYHLSPRRANLLRPFAGLLSGASVLEIGAGCGALTRYIGEAGAEVLAVEGSMRRAAIARSRTRDLANVSVAAADFGDFAPAGPFDIATLVGVLEYANLYASGPDPAGALLARVFGMLKPGGRLILAIENQLGLKYLAGAPEDHIGIPMYGVEGRYRRDQVATWGRGELEGMLTAAGFGSLGFLAPFPDYKLPISIVAEAGFADPEFDAGILATQSVRRDPQLPAELTMAPDLVWPVVARNGIGIDLANSFLVIAVKGRGEAVDPADLAWHFAAERAPAFCKGARFRRRAGVGIEVEYALFASGSTPRAEGPRLAFELPASAPYEAGRLLSTELNHILTREGWRVDHVAAFFARYMERIAEWAGEPDAPVQITGALTPLPGRLFDAVPRNIVVAPDGTWRSIDAEWTFKEPIPAGWLIFRSILMAFGEITRFGTPAGGATDLTPLQIVQSSLRASGMEITDAELATFARLELETAAEAGGKPMPDEASVAGLVDWLRSGAIRHADLLKTARDDRRAVDGLMEERKALYSEQQARIRERDHLIAHRDAIAAERDAARSEREAATAQIAALESVRQGLSTERAMLIGSRDELIGARDALSAENAALLAERGALSAENAALLAERGALSAENAALLRERGGLYEERLALARDRQETALKLEQITSSRLWRWTQPLRAAGARLKRMFGRGA